MNYKVTKEDLVGEIKDFPIEVVKKMVERQVEQYNKSDISVFQENIISGFLWEDAIEGHDFWKSVIYLHDFDLFFEKYPKKEINTHVYYRGNAERGKEIISELMKLGGINYYNISAQNIDCLYFILPKTKRIDFSRSGSTLYNIIEDAYTEKFLAEVQPETIQIDGKKYNKKEVLEKINELKEIK